MADLVVIIPTCNGLPVLKECLASLAGQTCTRFEILVMDNASTDGTAEAISRDYPRVRLVRFDINTGFARAVNEGIRLTRNPFILLLNNDTRADSRFIATQLDAIRTAPVDVAAINPAVLLMNSGKIDNIGIYLGKNLRPRQAGADRAAGWPGRGIVEVFGANACGAVFRRSFFDVVGLFDEDFFAYFEDVDLAIRGRLQGWRTLHNPNAVLHHHFAFTGNRVPAFKTYLLRRNYLYYTTKCSGVFTVILLFARLLAKDAGNLIHFLKNADTRKEGSAKLRAYRDFLMSLKSLLKKRKAFRVSGRRLPREWFNVEYRVFNP